MSNISKTKKAVILLSGGLDSATVLAIAKAEGYECYALSIVYGQRHAEELQCAKAQAELQAVKEHKIMHLDLRAFGGSALTDDIAVPKPGAIEAMGKEIPVTYVPARNTIFLSLAMAYAEVVGAFDIFVGVNALDYSGYPDCRPEYIDAFSIMANLGLAATVDGKNNLRFHTPLIALTKSEIVQKGTELGVDYGKTLSCYDPIGGLSCGQCDSCILRKKGFEEAGISDVTVYIA